VQQNNVRVLQRTLKDTRNRFDAGQVTSTDVAQSEAQLAAGEASLHAAESTVMTTRPTTGASVASSRQISLPPRRWTGCRPRR
jgi:outer membrane protein TolC